MQGEAQRSNKFIVNARWSIGFPKYKIFFVFLVGKDKRLEHLAPLQEQRYNQSFAKALIYSGLLAWVLVGFMALSFTALYLVKSYSGIDLVKGGSPFPSFLKRIRVCH